MSRPNPIDQPAEFDIRDLFFSTTDHRGIIQSGNDVFVKVSGYSKEDLMGKPHSIIRHPDMPRAVFRLFWNFIKEGRPIVAYVKNMSSNGRYYWVLALVQPVADGYLSIRIKPTSELFPKVVDLYRRMREAEGRGGMDAAATLLTEELQKLGFASYESFMIHALNKELKSADKVLAERNDSSDESHRSAHVANRQSPTALAERYIAEVGDLNQQIFAHIDQFVSVDKLLHERLQLISALNASLRRISINTAIQSERIGAKGACLSVVAGLIQKASQETLEQASLIQELATALVHEAGEVCFNLGAAKIQVDMLRRFMGEINAASEAVGSEALGEMHQNCELLISALESCTQVVVKSLGEFARRLGNLNALVGRLEEQVMTLEVARKSGVIEARRIGRDGEAFTGLLELIGTMVKEERQKLLDFTTAVRGVVRSASECGVAGIKVSHKVEEAKAATKDLNSGRSESAA